ncbi:MAG: Rossmann-like domain, partial [Cyanobacteriota bacterium]
MKIAVIGAGNVGSRLAKLFILAGHEITIGSREQEKAIAIAAQLGETVKGAKYADAVASA